MGSEITTQMGLLFLMTMVRLSSTTLYLFFSFPLLMGALKYNYMQKAVT